MNNKKKILVVAMTLSMVAILAIGGTLAYFTSEFTNYNHFQMGGVDIILDEAIVEFNPENNKWERQDIDEDGNVEDPTDGEQANRTHEQHYPFIMPGADLPKDPTVRNVGTNDSYVRVTVTFNPFYLGYIVNEEGTFNGLNGKVEDAKATATDRFIHLIGGEIGDGWVFQSEEQDLDFLHPENSSHSITFYYEDILKGNYYPDPEHHDLADCDATEPLFTNIHIPESLKDWPYDWQWDMELYAEAIQSDYFSSAENAWIAYEAQQEGETILDEEIGGAA